MFRIKFNEVTESSKSHLGGGAYLPSVHDWPNCPISGKPLMPLMTIRPSFFPTEVFGSPDVGITVFISVSYKHGYFYGNSAWRFAASDQKQFEPFKTGIPGGSRVIVHHMGEEELFLPTDFPYIHKHEMFLEKFTDEEFEEELSDPELGASLSKFAGRPAWLQDALNEEPKYLFNIQILEADIVKCSPAHEGIFNDGTGYLFLSKNLKKLPAMSEAGIFVVQFT